MGRVERALFERAADALRQHMFLEEELLFPPAERDIPGPIADLLDQHGRITDALDATRALLNGGADSARLQAAVRTFLSMLMIHSTVEDLGAYPEITAILGFERTQALIRKGEMTAPPAGWTCRAHRTASYGGSRASEAEPFPS